MDVNKEALHLQQLDWESQTIFKDAVLGYINVPKAVVRTLIDHEIFQRLHDVAQTGMETLYPNATHNRFCHSIGVYHLGKLAFQSFQQNVKNQHRDIYFQVSGNHSDQRECEQACECVWNRWRFLFEMACLLHDCGHSPLSHSLEFLYDVTESDGDTDIDISRKIANRFLLQVFEKSSSFKTCFIKEKSKNGDPIKVYGAPHERMSACLIVRGGEDGYRETLKRLIIDQMEYFKKTLTYANSQDQLTESDYGDNELLSDLEFMVRAIIGCPYNETSEFWGGEEKNRHIVYQLRNCIINLLNGTVDVDNIDYSIRDATASGYKSAQVDYERLLKAHTIALAYEHLKDEKNLYLRGDAFDYSVCLKNFKSDIIKRGDEPLSMTLSGSATLVVNMAEDGVPLVDDDEDPFLLLGLRMTGTIIEDDEKSSDKLVRIIHIQEGSSVSIILKRGQLTITPRDSTKESGTQLYIHSDNLRGMLIGTVFVGGKKIAHATGEDLQSKICEGTLRIFSAYHKSALSVIQGALDAANFESRWIYSHHVTTYHNNFLSVFLLEKYAEFCFDEECRHLLEVASVFLNFFDRFLGQDSNNEDLATLKKETNDSFEKAKRELEFAKVRLDLANCDNFPIELPPLIKGFDWEIYNILLRTLIILCKITTPFPISARRLSSDSSDMIHRIISILASFPQGNGTKPPITEAEISIFQRLCHMINIHFGIRKPGMPYMSALLGMPDEKRVNGLKYYRISDSDLRSMYHSLVKNTHKDRQVEYKDLFTAIKQYESRQYLSPMWKSHAEFHFYVHGWKKDWLQHRIQDFFSNDLSPVDQNGLPLYTYFSDQAVQQLGSGLKKFWDKVKEKFNLDILVYVPQTIKHKQLTGSRTYVIWKDRVVTMKDIGLQTNQDTGNHFFYLYYHCVDDMNQNIDVCAFMSFLQNELESWGMPNETPYKARSVEAPQSLM